MDTTAYTKFDFKKKSHHTLYVWDVPTRIIIGKYNNALETISKLSELLGRQPELPEWVFDGVWLGIQGGTEVVEQKIQRCLERGVPVTAAWCQDWQGIRMRKQKDGSHAVTIALSAGIYQYKFQADDDWLLDPDNHDSALNSFGTLNSLARIE